MRAGWPILLACCGVVSAHTMDQAAVLLDFRSGVIEAELQAPARDGANAALREFSVVAPSGEKFRIDAMGAPRLETIEGARYVVTRLRLTPPAGTSADLFDLHCGALGPVVLISVRTDWRTSTFANNPQLAAVLRGGERTVRIDRRSGSWWRGFAGVFQLGMRHIAEGTDHLLFLLALLLPAPLMARAGKWSGYAGTRACAWKIGGIVTAFTAGHSVTLALGAMNAVHVPSRPIETLIAVSILVSALHALRPLFPGREAVIAGCFGLVHGLAFATTLAELGLGRWDRVASIFGFNLGIECMQLIVVAVALPPLILLSRTRLYAAVRIAAAIFAGAAAAAWIAQRLWDAPNPADAVVMALAGQAAWIAAGLTLLGMVARSSPRLRVRPE